jgi:MFS family permease
MAFAWKYLTEIRTPGDDGKTATRTSREAVLRVITHASEPTSRLILIYAIAIGAFQGTNAILALYLSWRFGVTEDTIGYFYTYIGVLSVIVRALILGKLVERIGEPRLSRMGIVLLAVGLLGLSLSRDYVTLALAVGLLPLGTAFTFPCVTAMLSRVVSSAERGLYMGVQQTYGGITRVAFPVILGYAFDTLGQQSPYWISAMLVLTTLLMGRDLERYAPRSTPASA